MVTFPCGLCVENSYDAKLQISLKEKSPISFFAPMQVRWGHPLLHTRHSCSTTFVSRVVQDEVRSTPTNISTPLHLSLLVASHRQYSLLNITSWSRSPQHSINPLLFGSINQNHILSKTSERQSNQPLYPETYYRWNKTR